MGLGDQDKIDGAANAALEAPISIQVNDEIISFEFPDAQKNANITGEAWFYCSVDATKDKRFVLSVDSTGIQRIERKGLQKGDYQVKISYEINQKKYLLALTTKLLNLKAQIKKRLLQIDKPQHRHKHYLKRSIRLSKRQEKTPLKNLQK